MVLHFQITPNAHKLLSNKRKKRKKCSSNISTSNCFSLDEDSNLHLIGVA